MEGEEIASFSRQLDVKMLYQYAEAVMKSTKEILKTLQYPDLKRGFTEAAKERLSKSGCVSDRENAADKKQAVQAGTKGSISDSLLWIFL